MISAVCLLVAQEVQATKEYERNKVHSNKKRVSKVVVVNVSR